MSDDDLDLVETDRLVSALSRRSTGLVVAMTYDKDDDDEVTITRWSSHDVFRLIGISTYLTRRIMHSREECSRKIDDDEFLGN